MVPACPVLPGQHGPRSGIPWSALSYPALPCPVLPNLPYPTHLILHYLTLPRIALPTLPCLTVLPLSALVLPHPGLPCHATALLCLPCIDLPIPCLVLLPCLVPAFWCSDVKAVMGKTRANGKRDDDRGRKLDFYRFVLENKKVSNCIMFALNYNGSHLSQTQR